MPEYFCNVYSFVFLHPMNFLYPQFLLGFIALSIPIIVHLFNFRRTKKIQFSSNQFLKNIKEASTAKRKIKHYLILASRLLFICFLVLAFAQPFIPGINESEKNDLVYIYLDNSYSMSNEMTTDLSSFDQGIKFIDDLLEVYPQNARFKLLTNEFLPGSDILKTKEEIKEQIAEVTYSPISRTISEINTRLLKAPYSSEVSTKDIYWLTDFQRSTAGDLPSISFDSTGSYFLVPLEYQTPGNLYIDTVYLTNPFLLENEKNSLVISFKNTANESIQDVPVKLFLNNSQVANTAISVDGNSSIDESFELNQSLQRINTGRISFEEFPVTFDNDFYFTLNVDDRVDILEIRSPEASQVISQVYANDKLFNFSTYPVDNLNYNVIGNTDLIVLNELDNLSPSLADALVGFINDGGTISIVPAIEMDLDSFSSLLSLSRKAAVNASDKIDFRNPDLSNPFFSSMFVESDEVFEMPSGINRINSLNPGKEVLSLRNRENFLTEIVGQKKIFLFTVPFKDSYTNFHQHAIFVPVMYRIASLSNVLSDALYYTLNESLISMRVDSVAKNVIFKLEGQQHELIPAQRVLGRDVLLELPKNVMTTGYYNVMNEDEIMKIFSFNYDPDESIMSQYRLSELNDLFQNKGNVDVYEGDVNNDFTNSLKELHGGIPLWKYMLIIALVALLAEILIIRYL